LLRNSLTHSRMPSGLDMSALNAPIPLALATATYLLGIVTAVRILTR